MIKRIIIIGLIFLPVFIVNAYAQFAPVGTAGAQFLQIALGARPVGLGAAFTAMADDALSIYWNPAGLVRVEGHDLLTNYVPYFEGISYQSIAYAHNFGTFMGVIGLHLSLLSTGKMEVTTVYEQEGTGEFFSAQDMAGGISYARWLTDRFSIGGNIKFLRERYWTYTASGWALDIGTIYQTEFRSLRLGMCILNFGPELKFTGKYIDYSEEKQEKEFKPYALPMTFKVGIAMDIVKDASHHIVGAFDGVHTNDNIEAFNLGIEYWYTDILALRAGYRINYDEGGLTTGLGFRYALGTAVAKLDYAFDDMGRLGIVHRVSFGLGF